jgi:hypothetical protein
MDTGLLRRKENFVTDALVRPIFVIVVPVLYCSTACRNHASPKKIMRSKHFDLIDKTNRSAKVLGRWRGGPVNSPRGPEGLSSARECL